MEQLRTAGRQVARDYLFRSSEWLFTRGLRVARPLLFSSPPPRPWKPGGRVLVVAPHPDDETLGAGGTLALHRRHGDTVTVVVITDGRRSRAAGLAPAAMAHRRAAEISAAAEILDLTQLVCLNLPEGAWEAPEARERLAPLLNQVDIVYAPSCVDFHPEHLRVARLLGELIQAGQTVRVFELGVPLTPLLTNLVADISPVMDQKRRALACFVSQAKALASATRLARYRSVLYGLPVEPFWELPAAEYGRAMQYGRWEWQNSPFRGIRPRPLSDPLAFLAGWRTRRHLRQLAKGEAR